MHMASHTFVRLGLYHDGIQSNVRAFAADLEDVKQCREPYLPEHNLEMLIYSATLGGEVMPNLHNVTLSSLTPIYMPHSQASGGLFECCCTCTQWVNTACE